MNSQREVISCACGLDLVVVARFRAAVVLRLSWARTCTVAEPGPGVGSVSTAMSTLPSLAYQ
ncbi:putative protein OS=Kitasatospora aureofaciens OX=1894 GN=HS99_0026960 PE=4 SV=1 [Kitasatospora aureofaciens]